MDAEHRAVATVFLPEPIGGSACIGGDDQFGLRSRSGYTERCKELKEPLDFFEFVKISVNSLGVGEPIEPRLVVADTPLDARRTGNQSRAQTGVGGYPQIKTLLTDLPAKTNTGVQGFLRATFGKSVNRRNFRLTGKKGFQPATNIKMDFRIRVTVLECPE